MSTQTAHRAPASGLLTVVGYSNAALTVLGVAQIAFTGQVGALARLVPVALLTVCVVARITGDPRTLHGLAVVLAAPAGIAWAVTADPAPWGGIFIAALGLLLLPVAAPARRRR